MPLGRPSTYSPAYAEEVITFCAEGYSLTAFAGEIGVARSTINEWIGKHPEFSEAVNRAKAKRAHWWEQKARAVAADGGTGAQGTMIIFGLKNHASEDFREKQEVEHSGSLSTLSETELSARIIAKLIEAGMDPDKARAIAERG